MFLIALLHGLIELPRWVIRRNVETCHVPGYNPSVSFNSGDKFTMSVGDKLETFKTKTFLTKLKRLVPTWDNDITAFAQEHINRLSSADMQANDRIFQIFVNAYNSQTGTITLDQYQFDNTKLGNNSLVQLFQATATSQYDDIAPLTDFIVLTSYFIENGVPKDVQSDASVPWDVLLRKEYVNAASIPYYTTIFGLTFAPRDPFTLSALAELSRDLEGYMKYVPYIQDSVEYVRGAIDTFRDNGRLEVSDLNKVIQKLCIEKLITPTPTATPEPTETKEAGKSFWDKLFGK